MDKKEIAWMENVGAEQASHLFRTWCGGYSGKTAELGPVSDSSAMCGPSKKTIVACVVPKCENNKGVVDLYRRPKLSYNTVKAAYTAKNEY